ncbi:Uncharacterised protein [uncultured Flavonifractor sp.]|nr:Uncharacterised protein [uncultured Flavonifractor sp.]
MKLFLKKLVCWAVVMAAIMVLSDATDCDPMWYLMGIWLWKDLSDTLGKESGKI